MLGGFEMASTWWREKFRGHGYRLTVPRQAVLDVLGKTSDHLSAEDVYFEVHRIYPDIGLTTVYRTLELLVQMGLASKFDFGDSRARYELSEGPKGVDHHHHLVCTNCGKIIDYADFIEEETELVKRTEEGLSRRFNFKITNHIMQFYGLCDKCRKER
jgi:Fur family ferric uptake transcriptional regulator